MKKLISLLLMHLVTIATVPAQSSSTTPPAANPVLLTQATDTTPTVRELKIPAGTPLEIEAAYTVSSLDVRVEDLISFRVIVPVKVDGLTVIEKYALVTGMVVQAKRGGHWGRAGKLAWIMRDVVAVDLTRVPLQAQRDVPGAGGRVTGTSRGGQVATEMIVFGSLMWFAAPLVLMSGFKRGDNAVLPEGKRFVVYVQKDTAVKIPDESGPAK